MTNLNKLLRFRCKEKLLNKVLQKMKNYKLWVLYNKVFQLSNTFHNKIFKPWN
jgi:hypothetical protein